MSTLGSGANVTTNSNEGLPNQVTGKRTPNGWSWTVPCFRRALPFFALGGCAGKGSAAPDRVRVGAVENTWK